MTLNLTVAGSGEPLSVRPERLVVAGYTARDEESVARHIEELAAIGVPPPPAVPMFYDLDPALLSTDALVEVGGASTSGEVEPVLVRHRGAYFLGVGSDHTDREIERTDIAASKAACPKPVGGDVAEIGLDFPGWDEVEARSEVDGRPYQAGAVSTLRHPAELVERMTATLGGIAGDLVLFCGTLALLGGTFVHGDRWSLSLSLPAGSRLTHTYTTRSGA
ncbi:DUF2848 domain-containing protein [Actinomadura darangshiensis]|uniref:DUF2848 domain-containing protein n=1 Tax=Actinomadura darangshiensis TaxID=705336 RepID=A0A4R5AM99_9ACTN|nr:DUF2848 family protein [Actinomadura darangshiensis]TDD72800.1 DUF2848 domain-containing protein [Actinomadura darangshiensis]